MASSSLYDRSIPPVKLWSPPNGGQDTATFRFLRQVNGQHNLSLQTYSDLWAWSTSPENTSRFWDDVWDFTQVLGVKGERGAVGTQGPKLNGKLIFPARNARPYQGTHARRITRVGTQMHRSIGPKIC